MTKITKVNPKLLSDDDLITYFLYLDTEDDTASIIRSIMGTAIDKDELIRLLRRVVNDGIRLAICYPGYPAYDKSPGDVEIVAGVMDGYAYVVR